MTGLVEAPEFDFDFLFEFNQSDEGAGGGGSGQSGAQVAEVYGMPAWTSNPVISIVPSTNHPSGYGGHADSGTAGYYLSPNVRSNGVPALESPRIEITSYLGLHHNNNQFFHEAEVEEAIPNAKRSPSTATLNLPNIEAYRDPSCLSPASSLSSRSCNSEASSYESNYSYPYTSPQTSPWQSPCVSPKTTDTEEGYQRSMVACTLLNSPRHSPSGSPRTSITEENWVSGRNSRPSSPCNKRKYSLNGRQTSYSPHHSPTPSPQSSPRVSVTDETWLGNTNQYTSSAIVAAINALTTDSTIDMNDGIPIKSRKTAIDHTPSMTLKTEPSGEDHGTISPTADLSPEEFPGFQHIRKGNFCDQYLSVPQHPYQWAKSKPLSPTSYMRIATEFKKRTLSLCQHKRHLHWSTYSSAREQNRSAMQDHQCSHSRGSSPVLELTLAPNGALTEA
uniref:Nuclear factor of activated T-cells, cytoplasmic 1 n=1 Tax=Sphaerodactylus townsendi TaxID=933632 RepID=A0ACB8FD29_9SAUR